MQLWNCSNSVHNKKKLQKELLIVTELFSTAASDFDAKQYLLVVTEFIQSDAQIFPKTDCREKGQILCICAAHEEMFGQIYLKMYKYN